MSQPSSATSPPFQAGTLRYSRSGLARLFIWLLWGDFCFQVMEMVVLQVLPLKLKSLEAPNLLIGVIVGTIPSAMNFIVNPIVGFRSDRYRSRLGRRIPFLLWATPPLAFFLILLGCSEELGNWAHRSLAWLGSLSATTLILCLVAFFTICFQLFNMVINSVYYYLINDVVPSAFIGRFLGLFRVVAALAGILFAFFVFPHAQSHMREIFIGAGLLYFVAFMMMCLKVREGDYPPAPRNAQGRTGMVAAARTYFAECFNHRFYWDYFLVGTFYAIAGCTSPFMVFLYLSVGVDLAHIGRVLGITQIISFLLMYPAGIWSDRAHPVRVMLIATSLLVLTSAAALMWLFIDPSPRLAFGLYTAYALGSAPVIVLYGIASLPMSMRLLARERYGQFCSADAMLRSLAIILATPVLGLVLDGLKWKHHGDPYYYRYAPLWTVAFHCLSLVFLWRVYRYWKGHGADEGFQPPLSAPVDAAAAPAAEAVPPEPPPAVAEATPSPVPDQAPA